ncbi:MAG: phosphoglycerate kinase [Candidatus Vogelbacteria bacterium]|nr:phosphoglycerate kinase [Candidatus Vogelbacteria bacterium]
MTLPSIRSIPAIRGKRIIVRAALNAPLEGGAVGNDFRLRANLETLRFLQGAGARLSVLGHVEQPGADSLRSIYEWLSRALTNVRFADGVSMVGAVRDGEIVLLENVRRHEGEKKNDPVFSQELASLGEIFVNEAFADSHREHASIVGLPLLMPSYVGFRFEEEVKNLSRAFSPRHPFVVILGGAKFSTKLPLIERFVAVADTIFIGGALVIDFYRTLGYEVGMSLVSDGEYDFSRLLANEKIKIARDAVVQTKDGERRTVNARDVSPREAILDNGPAFVSEIARAVSSAKFVLWNGPLGNFERGFWESTHGVAQAIASSAAESIVGGGDTITAITRLNLFEKFDFVSTGGGAMLDFLATGTLPGIEAIRMSPKFS